MEKRGEDGNLVRGRTSKGFKMGKMSQGEFNEVMPHEVKAYRKGNVSLSSLVLLFWVFIFRYFSSFSYSSIRRLIFA